MTSETLAFVVGTSPAIQKPQRRSARRFAIDTAVCWRAAGDGPWQIGLVENASLGGMRLGLAAPAALHPGDRIELSVPLVGDATARVTWIGDEALGLTFEDLAGETRDRLLRLLHSRGLA